MAQARPAHDPLGSTDNTEVTVEPAESPMMMNVDSETSRLIADYGLRRDMEELYERLLSQTVVGIRVAEIEVEKDALWNEARPRVLMTIRFASTIAEAVEAWNTIYHEVIKPVSPWAIGDEKLAFHVDTEG